MLKPGDPAPDFALRDDDGEEVRLRDLLKAGPLILYFYPADFTPGCTKEACDLRDLHADVLRAGLRVFGVSPQDAASHRRFRDRHQLPFHLLADPDKRAIRAFGVDGPLGLGVRRATFWIDADGTIRDVVRADLRVWRHRDFVDGVIGRAERTS